MREIKFRVFNNGYGISYNPKFKEGFLNEQFMEDDGWIYSQCTGLKDKNGREIYEGDIVKHKYWIMSGPMIDRPIEDRAITVKIDFDILFVNKPLYETIDIFSVKIPNFYYKLESIREGCCYKSCRKTAKYLEIIGNIYENPELLEAGK